MKRYILTLLFCGVGTLFAQKLGSKKQIDFEAISDWEKVYPGAIITDDGKYMAYFVGKNKFLTCSLVVASTDGKWSRQLPGDLANGTTRFIGNDRLIYSSNSGLLQLSLPDGTISKFSESKAPKTAEIMAEYRQLENKGITTIELYDKSLKRYRTIVNDSLLQSTRKLKISEANLLPSGNFVLRLTKLKKPDNPLNPIKNIANVTVWNYTDVRLQSEQKARPEEQEQQITTILFSQSGKIEILDDERHTAVRPGSAEVWLLGRKGTEIRLGQRGVVNGYKIYDQVISTFDGKRKQLDKMDTVGFKTNLASDNEGRYIGYFDPESGCYLSYDVKMSKTLNLTPADIDFQPYSKNLGSSIGYRSPGKYTSDIYQDLGGFLIVYDEFDIWKLDLSNKKPAICLTSHYGKENGIVLRFPDIKLSWDKTKVLLYGFGKKTKMNGMFSVDLDKPSMPRKLLWDNAVWYNPSELRPDNSTTQAILKAKNADVILLMKQTCTNSPNWFAVTPNGTRQLSFVNPENKYNWITSELVNWKNEEADSLQGVLYKPENFDASKKYPVVVEFYESYSNGLNGFLYPGLFRGSIDIPWLVSRGYLVFRPDIVYRQGKIGQSALDCINSGTNEISKLPYVDTNRIGIAGHSFGGFEAAYLVTHSNRYKAALIGAPMTDFISKYNHLTGGLSAQMGHRTVEWSQGAMMVSMWDRPEWYIENSAIFNLDKVTTPILLMHNDKDRAVPYFQGMEMFLGLYRLGKPAWLLQYDGLGHILGDDEQSKRDYTIRATQFFDHYLKGAPAPTWMLDGIAYKDREIKQGYELDSTGRKPGPSPIVDAKEYKKIEEYSKIPLSEKLKRMSEPKREN